MLAIPVLLILLSVVPAQSPGECSTDQIKAGICTTNTGTDIIIDGTHETGGTDGTETGPDDWQVPTDPGTPQGPSDLDTCLDDWESDKNCFDPIAENEEEDEDPGIPPVTITDLVRFAPAGSVLTGEPNNVGVAGLPTNFVTAASTQTVAGELFGFPLSVRFTPAAYDFIYGDGATSTSSTGGATWADLAQVQFTPTDTSHAYRERGTYIAQVNVRYSAEVDFGTGWFPVTGQVTANGAPQEIRIFEAHTALVAFTCAEAPHSPGC
ncbi:hypothetical protein ACTU6V_11090 [Microbacterium sp. A204]|uniref:hypothetical protein n=1 Tax=Microbacterium sp. A204 TaxID=3457321 RepID=UPI003FD54B0E